jgi:mono/diheme cytochrome c family protein
LKRCREIVSRPSGLFVLALAALTGCASSQPSSPRTAQLSGAELYGQLCASCHGANGKGGGPVASVLKVRVPDLTRIAWRDGGEFSREDVRRAIDGRLEYRAHGSREMPVWGIRFYDLSSADEAVERAKVDTMIDKLVDYLESVQDRSG